jgi:hypothetical protein
LVLGSFGEPELPGLGGVEVPISVVPAEGALVPAEPELPVPGVVEVPLSLEPLEPPEPGLPKPGGVEEVPVSSGFVLTSSLLLLHPVIKPIANIAPKTQTKVFFIFLVSSHLFGISCLCLWMQFAFLSTGINIQ